MTPTVSGQTSTGTLDARMELLHRQDGPGVAIGMAMWSAGPTSDARENTEAMATEFTARAERWHRDTDLYSFEMQKVAHPAYQRIIGMGQKVIPLVLRDLETNGGLWYQALESILGYNPIPVNEPGDIRRLKSRWLEWGRKFKSPTGIYVLDTAMASTNEVPQFVLGAISR